MFYSESNFFVGDSSFNYNFRSIFEYSSLSDRDTDFDQSFRQPVRETPFQLSIKYFLIGLTVSVLILTFPISVWFSIKRIKPLERCIIYRLGRRLPVKGPGLIFTLPCLDILDYVDLSPQEVIVTEKEQMLTHDGSLVELINFKVEISVTNAVKSSSHLKDSKFNVVQFIKLFFVNAVGGAHVEDLERKMEFFIRKFIENCNRHINRWGWSVTESEIPKMIILNRVEPANPVLKVLKEYFNVGSSEKNQDLGTNILPSNKKISEESQNIEIDALGKKLKRLLESYPGLSLMGPKSLTVSLTIKETGEEIVFNVDLSKKSITKAKSNTRADVFIKAQTRKELEDSVDKGNISSLDFSTRF